MKRDELDFDLPEELIAQRPAVPRDAARLLVVNRDANSIEHHTFLDLTGYLRSGDALVLNNTRVLPARFFCRRSTGGEIEALFLRAADNAWRVLLRPSARLRIGETLYCVAADQGFEIRTRLDRGEWEIQPVPPVDPVTLLERIGQTPLPPYIRRPEQPDAADRERYQTVYAEHAGAVAAPTAGLHFTPELLEEIEAAGVQVVRLTLHVGMGTFAPILADDLSDHLMHAEYYEIAGETLADLNRVRRSGGRIVAVGTTSVRVLETLSGRLGADMPERTHTGWTNIFIYPPYQYRNVDRLLTNFHLPGSTLIALVMAFADRDLIRAAYQAAIEARYRFYSYGDAMLIL